ncbi:MAG: hypothetical protein SV186_01640 [Candidatus Nanohaloarchaea archaeon]|nr:hypothetical protein [Candidatus Nanohaloarchaea archaeon]
MDQDLEKLLTEIRTAIGGISEDELLQRSELNEAALKRQLHYLQDKGSIEKEETDLATYWKPAD